MEDTGEGEVVNQPQCRKLITPHLLRQIIRNVLMSSMPFHSHRELAVLIPELGLPHLRLYHHDVLLAITGLVVLGYATHPCSQQV